MKGKVIILRSVLAIACVFCIAVQEKNKIPSTNAISKESNIPSANAVSEESSISSADATTSKKDSIPSVDTVPEKINIPSTDRRKDNGQNHLGELDEDAENPEHAVQTDDTVLAISSEDKQYTVFTRRECRQKLYIYNAEENKLDQIDVTPDSADSIMTLEWIAPDKVAVWSHASPSMGCLDIYDVNSLQKLVEKYCSFYSLTEEIDSLVYVESSPRCSGYDTILNIDDEILYQTGDKEIISSIDINKNSNIAIVVEKEDENYETESTDLVVLKKKGKIYKISEKISLAKRTVEEIHWTNNHKISYSTRRGKNKVINLKNP